MTPQRCSTPRSETARRPRPSLDHLQSLPSPFASFFGKECPDETDDDIPFGEWLEARNHELDDQPTRWGRSPALRFAEIHTPSKHMPARSLASTLSPFAIVDRSAWRSSSDAPHLSVVDLQNEQSYLDFLKQSLQAMKDPYDFDFEAKLSSSPPMYKPTRYPYPPLDISEIVCGPEQELTPESDSHLDLEPEPTPEPTFIVNSSHTAFPRFPQPGRQRTESERTLGALSG
ncbi:uncharacterized protein BJ171DRAFT_493026, partial [Polychytrium aggregatum]|uniref:uncharacterized protein n=1 Tax=Polychytrium aggregatum TaxID=110093 RepID=UPI0022FEA6D9